MTEVSNEEQSNNANVLLATVDYYKECPFTIGLIYTEGIYKGRYDAWNNYFGAFMFDCNGEQRLIHPTDINKILSVNLL